jgi:predicted CopG family antitoxin
MCIVYIMAVKTITVDMEAYDILAREKQEGESFSQVIKRRLGPPRASKKLLRLIQGLRPETMRAVKKHLRDSRKERAM